MSGDRGDGAGGDGARRDGARGNGDRGGSDRALVRPYMMTRGRTRPVGERLALEALVMTTAAGTRRLAGLSDERRRIAVLCRGRGSSVAEVAADIGVPLGVARVLIGDLRHQGVLEVGEARGRPGIALLKEVLDGLLTG